MIPAQTKAIGIPWYYRQDYRRILDIMEDAGSLPETYHGWLKLAEKAESDYKRQGFIVVRAIVDPSKFPAWAAARGLNVDAKARMQWANEFAKDCIPKTH
jgi:hypothetical protein